MKFTLAAAAFAATALFSQPAKAATMIEINASATGTTSSMICTTGPQCSTTNPFAAAFNRTIALGDFVNGAAFFQVGANSNGGLLSGTVLDLGGGRLTGIDFSFSQLRNCSGAVPCLNYSTNLSAATFSVRQLFPGVSAVPEPGTWATMLIGFGAIGSAMRRAARPRRLSLV